MAEHTAANSSATPRVLLQWGGVYNQGKHQGGFTVDGMTGLEIVRLINKYVGVSADGYLGDFSYRTHKEFYPLYCNLEIDPEQIKGSTRARFQEILRTSPPDMQAKIVRGILMKYPRDPEHPLRTQEVYETFLKIAQRLEGVAGVATPTLATTSEVVERALADAEHLLKTTGATSGVDRLHTAIHGYMRAVCDREGTSYTQEATINGLFNLIRSKHPAFAATGPRADDITKIMRAMGQVMDVLNPIRNQASVAHPNQQLLEEAEAMLVINLIRSMLHYLNAKLA
jgi:hypothetical protein